MSDAAIRARLVVRGAGLALALMVIPSVGHSVHFFATWGSETSQWPLGPDLRIWFYSIEIDGRFVATWLEQFSVPTALFVAGAVMVLRGSRMMERKVARVIGA